MQLVREREQAAHQSPFRVISVSSLLFLPSAGILCSFDLLRRKSTFLRGISFTSPENDKTQLAHKPEIETDVDSFSSEVLGRMDVAEC